MPKSTLIIIFVLVLLTSLLGYNYFAKPLQNWTPPWVVLSSPTPASVEPSSDELQQLIEALTPRQKLSQMMAAPLTVGTDFSNDSTRVVGGVSQERMDTILGLDPGWITLFGQNVTSTDAAEVTASISARISEVGIAPTVAVDHEGGTVQRLSGAGFTRLPSWQEICQLPDAQRKALVAQSAKELFNVGVNVVLAPMADYGSANTVLKNRVCSSDPELVAERAAEFRTIFDNQGIGAVIKHFPGIGSTKKDLHTNYDQVEVSTQAAALFRRLVLEEQPPNLNVPQSEPTITPVSLLAPAPAVMVSHVGVLNQYGSIPCSLSPDCIGELKAVLPTTIVFSDALDMKAAAYDSTGLPKDLPTIAEQALLAGNDVLIFGPGVTPGDLERILVHLETRYQANPVLRAKIDTSLYKTLAYRQWLVANSKQ